MKKVKGEAAEVKLDLTVALPFGVSRDDQESALATSMLVRPPQCLKITLDAYLAR